MAEIKWISGYFSSSHVSVGLVGKPMDAIDVIAFGYTHTLVSVNLASSNLGGCTEFYLKLEARFVKGGDWHEVTANPGYAVGGPRNIIAGKFGNSAVASGFPWMAIPHHEELEGGAGLAIDTPVPFPVTGMSEIRWVAIGDSAAASVTPALTVIPGMFRFPTFG